MSYFEESEAHEWGPGGQPSASKQIDIYEKSNKRQSAKDFLNKFATGVNESMEADKRNRSSNTEAAQGGSSSSSSSSNDSKDKVQSGMANLGKDIAIQQGFRGKEETIAGTPGRKGILGHVARGAGAAFGGPWGAMAGNVIGSQLDYV